MHPAGTERRPVGERPQGLRLVALEASLRLLTGRAVHALATSRSQALRCASNPSERLANLRPATAFFFT
jgi:hypothetical protein